MSSSRGSHSQDLTDFGNAAWSHGAVDLICWKETGKGQAGLQSSNQMSTGNGSTQQDRKIQKHTHTHTHLLGSKSTFLVLTAWVYPEHFPSPGLWRARLKGGLPEWSRPPSQLSCVECWIQNYRDEALTNKKGRKVFMTPEPSTNCFHFSLPNKLTKLSQIENFKSKSLLKTYFLRQSISIAKLFHEFLKPISKRKAY